MKRPKYQSKKDEEEERRAAQKLVESENWNCDYYERSEKLKHYDTFLFKDCEASGAAEIKRRYNDRYRYRSYYISKDKWDNLCKSNVNTERELGVSVYLVVQWDDDIGWIKCDPQWIEDNNIRTWEGIISRKGRDDPKDTEHGIHFDPRGFKEL